MRRIRFVDSHTGGEPTRTILAGGPDLGEGPVATRALCLRDRHDALRGAMVVEPRGSEALVGALLCEPSVSGCAAGVIFFNNAGTLGMCGHGTIGVVATLAHLGRLHPGRHCLETPVGVVGAELHDDGRVTVANVPSYRLAAGVEVAVPGRGRIHGDVAWGGNWFFLVHDHGCQLSLANLDELTAVSWSIRRALVAAGVSGADGAEIDHVELLGTSPRDGLDGRNFVLCPGGAYDRSPCGTGTSAELACLHGDGRLAPGRVWRQESITGSVFEALYELVPDRPGTVLPRITGEAFVTVEGELLFDPRDSWSRVPGGS